MSAKELILSIDLGTGGPKVALVASDGSIVAATVRPVHTTWLGADAAEQDPEAIWLAIVSAAQQVIRQARRPAEEIVGVTCTSQYFSIVPIDAAGLPVGNMIPWMDGRGGAATRRLYAEHPDAFTRWLAIAGMPPLPSGNDSLSHMLFLKYGKPEIYERAAKLVEPADYVTTRLTGRCTSNACTAFAQLLTDNRDLANVAYHDELIALSTLDREKLPELVPVGSRVGTVRKEIAEALGLGRATPVFAGVNDTHAAAIGTGVHLPGRGALNIGTTCQVLAFVDSMRADVEHWILAMPSPIRDRYMVMAEIGLGGKPLEHFLENFVFADDELAHHAIADPFANVEKTLRSTPPGSGGLLYLPWLSGSQSPVANGAMRGAFLNISLETNRACMLRAVLEGVAFSLRWALPVVEDFADTKFDALQFSGGGAVSPEWAQIMADTMARPVRRLADPRHVNNRGTAFLAFEELGLASLGEVDKLCRIEQVHEPRPEQRDLYARLFEQFVAAHERTRPIFEALNG
jgi:xylulokinase